MDKTIFLARLRAFPWKKCSLRPGKARLQKWRAWERRSHAFPPTLSHEYKQYLSLKTSSSSNHQRFARKAFGALANRNCNVSSS